jgi:hypothetical protein
MGQQLLTFDLFHFISLFELQLVEGLMTLCCQIKAKTMLFGVMTPHLLLPDPFMSSSESIE